MCLCLVSPGWGESGAVRLFWGDKDLGRIESSDLDGGNRVLVHSGLGDPRGVAVDAVAGMLYWAVRQPAGAIYRSNCDGTGTELVIGGLSDPGDIELDLENGRIYWTEESANKIMYASLDGTAVEMVLGGLNRPYYLAVDGEFVYWSDFDSPVIHRANLVNPVATNFITGLGQVRDVEVADGMIYWCDRDTSDVRRRALDGVGTGTVLFSGAGFDRPHGLALDPESGTMFWTDTRTVRIDSGAMDGSGAPSNVAVTTLAGPWALAIARPVPLSDPYESWTWDNFTGEELLPENEASVWGEAADPDGDGRINLLEYAQGTDPKGAVLPGNLVEVEVGETVRVVVRMRAGDSSLQFWLESKEDLNPVTWSAGGFTEVGERVADASDSDYEFVTMEVEQFAARLFVRLRVSR